MKNQSYAELFPHNSLRQAITLFIMVSLKKKICNYIAKEWISKSKSNRQFADDHAIDEKVVRRILEPEGNGISLTTIERICEAREIKISEFFQMIDE